MADIHGLPCDIIFVRHGESEGNVASKFEDKGIEDLRARIASKSIYDFRLTKKGIAQAQATGKWIRENVSTKFDKYYTSDLLRARETAAYLNFSDAKWLLETDIREQYLPSRSTPSMDISLTRSVGIEQFIDTLLRSCVEMSVIVVCHATTIRSFMIRLEKLQYQNLSDVKKNPDLNVKNCEVVWYSRRNPSTQKVSPEISWKAMIVPYQTPKLTRRGVLWRKLIRPSFSNLDLMKSVEDLSPLLIVETEEELERKYKEGIEEMVSRDISNNEVIHIGSSMSSSSFENVDITTLL